MTLPRRHASLSLPLIALLAAACMPPSNGPKRGGGSKEPMMGKASPEAWANVKSQAENALKQCQDRTAEADAKLGEVLGKFTGKKPDAMGKPLPHVNEVVAKLAKEKVTVVIEDKGGPGLPQLFVKDSFMEEGQKLQGAPPAKMQAFAKRAQVVTPPLSALRDQVMTVNQALMTSLGSTQTCTSAAKSYSTMLGAVENGGDTPPDDVFDVYAKLLQANARSESVVAASVALVGVTQAAIAGKNPKSVDALLGGIEKLKDSSETVTTDQARQVYKAAGQALIDACQAQLDKYYADHPEAKKPDGPSPCSKEGLAKDREKWNKGPDGGGDSGGAGSEGGGGLLDEGLRRLIPKDSVVNDVAGAFDSLKKGDYVGTLKGAMKLVGKNVPFGGVLNEVLGFLG